MDASEEHAENRIKDLPSNLQHSYQRMIEEINQLTVSVDDLTSFCNGVVNGIQNIFEYYSVNLYIVDSERKWAILKASTNDERN